MILFLIAAAIAIVIAGFVLYNNGFDAGYSTGHDHGFRHANGDHLPPLDNSLFDAEVEELMESRWKLTASGREYAEELRAYEKGMSETTRVSEERHHAEGGAA